MCSEDFMYSENEQRRSYLSVRLRWMLEACDDKILSRLKAIIEMVPCGCHMGCCPSRCSCRSENTIYAVRLVSFANAAANAQNKIL